MKTIKRILKKWLGINELRELCDERDIYVNKRIGEEVERFNQLFNTNKRKITLNSATINDAVKTYDKMLDRLNKLEKYVQFIDSNKRLLKLEAIVNNDIGNNKDEAKDIKYFELFIDSLVNDISKYIDLDIGNTIYGTSNKNDIKDIILTHINLNNKGGCDND